MELHVIKNGARSCWQDRKAIIFLGEGKEVPPELKKDYYREKKKSAERLQKQGVPLIITTRISEILFFGLAAQYYGSAL